MEVEKHKKRQVYLNSSQEFSQINEANFTQINGRFSVCSFLSLFIALNHGTLQQNLEKFQLIKVYIVILLSLF